MGFLFLLGLRPNLLWKRSPMWGCFCKSDLYSCPDLVTKWGLDLYWYEPQQWISSCSKDFYIKETQRISRVLDDVGACVWAYSSLTRPTSLHSRRLHHSGRCRGYSDHTRTGTPPRCRWLPSHLRLPRKTHMQTCWTDAGRDGAALGCLRLFEAATFLCWYCQKLHMKWRSSQLRQWTYLHTTHCMLSDISVVNKDLSKQISSLLIWNHDATIFIDKNYE